MADIDLSVIPDEYTIHTDSDLLSGEITLHTDNDLLSDIHIRELPKLTLDASIDASIKEIPVINTNSQLAGTLDVGLSDIRVKELPVVHLRFGAEPTRVHLPGGWKFGFSVLGAPIFSFDLCGESMVVIEDYKAHKKEVCE